MKNKLWWAWGIIGILAMAILAGCTTTASTNAPAGSNQVVQAQNQPLNLNLSGQQTGIWVNGKGTVTVTPNIATLTLGVSAQAARVADAQAQAATAMDKVMSSLTGNGVDKKDIKTQNFSIDQVTRYDNTTQQSVVTGYRVSNTVIVRVRAIDKTGVIIDAVAVAAGDLTRINGISFSVDQPEQYYPQALQLAMADAKNTADQLAKLGGVTLGKPVYITQNVQSTPIPYTLSAANVAAAPVPQTAISAGTTDIVISVQVAYAIQ